MTEGLPDHVGSLATKRKTRRFRVGGGLLLLESVGLFTVKFNRSLVAVGFYLCRESHIWYIETCSPRCT